MSNEDKIRILNPDFDLSEIKDLELIETMQDLCNTYVYCRYGMDTATEDVWESIVRVAEEIVKRE